MTQPIPQLLRRLWHHISPRCDCINDCKKAWAAYLAWIAHSLRLRDDEVAIHP